MSNAQEPVATNFFSYMRVTYVFESRFSAGTIYPISMIFDVVNKEQKNFKKTLFIFCRCKHV